MIKEEVDKHLEMLNHDLEEADKWKKDHTYQPHFALEKRGREVNLNFLDKLDKAGDIYKNPVLSSRCDYALAFNNYRELVLFDLKCSAMLASFSVHNLAYHIPCEIFAGKSMDVKKCSNCEYGFKERRSKCKTCNDYSNFKPTYRVMQICREIDKMKEENRDKFEMLVGELLRRKIELPY